MENQELEYQHCAICFRKFNAVGEIKPHYQLHEDVRRIKDQMPQNGD